MRKIKYRLATTEYVTLKGFGLNCSVEKEYDTDESVKNVLKYQEEKLSESIPESHIQHDGTMGFMVIDNSTGLILTSIVAYPYLIDDDKKEYLYRGYKITTEFDSEVGKDFLLIHRLDGRPYLYRSTLMGALDTIDWIECSITNAVASKQVLNNINEKKEGN